MDIQILNIKEKLCLDAEILLALSASFMIPTEDIKKSTEFPAKRETVTEGNCAYIERRES